MGSCCCPAAAAGDTKKTIPIVKGHTSVKYKTSSSNKKTAIESKSNSITNKAKVGEGKGQVTKCKVANAITQSTIENIQRNTVHPGNTFKAKAVSPCSKEILGLALNGSDSSSVLSCASTNIKVVSNISLGSVNAKPLFRKQYQFRLDRTSPLFSESSEVRKAALHKTRLYKDRKLKKTVSGEDVVQEPTKLLLTKKRFLKAMKKSEITSPEVKTIMVPPFTSMDQIVDGVYLTGFYGMLQENVTQEKISLIINASYEIPLYKNDKLPSYRVPVMDSDKDPIGTYFDDVADLIEGNRRSGGHSAVHCMAGVSRSSTLILAYLIKYTTLNLHEAFVHCKATRVCIRPNLGFFRQLIEYECKLNGRASTKMVEIEDKETHRKATVPDFFPNECPDLFQVELDRQNNRSKH